MVFTKDSEERIMDITNNMSTPALDAALALIHAFSSDAATSKVSEVSLAECHSISILLLQFTADQSSLLSLLISYVLVNDDVPMTTRRDEGDGHS